jgi:SAM-dependent methyltransferase
MGYGRNALWLAEQGYEVEGWEEDARYIREAREELKRRQERFIAHPKPRPLPTPEERVGANVAPNPSTRSARSLRVPQGLRYATTGSALRSDRARGATRKEGRARRARLRVKFRVGDFTRAQLRGPYDVIVISLALHQVKRSAGLRVLRAARRALREGGRLFLLVKLTRDRYFQRWKRSPDWEPVAGERNTLRRVASHPQPWLLPALKRKHSDDVAPEGAPRQWRIERVRRRGQIQSALTPSELKAALRGLKVRHYREVVLRSDWDESERLTHHVAEVVAEKRAFYPRPRLRQGLPAQAG